MFALKFLPLIALSISATPVIFDGRVPFNVTNSDLDTSTGPFLTIVKGATENATHYSTLLGHSLAPTPLWNEDIFRTIEQPVSVRIDNTSIFIPGGSTPQYGFRRTDLIAQPPNGDGDHTTLVPVMENGTTVFHFSIMKDEEHPLNYTHEYQIVWIEPDDGSHVFGIQLGSLFNDPTGPLPAPNAHSLQVLDHASTILFTTPFSSHIWHNFAVRVDWDDRTLAAFYSEDDEELRAVTEVVPNLSVAEGPTGQGDFHIALLKLPLANPADSPADQADVVHFGIQEGTTEGLIYSGVFVEGVEKGLSLGNDRITKPLLW